MNERRRTILVTGGNGFIGSALLRRFAEGGWRAIGASRRKPADRPGIEWRAYDLSWTDLPDAFFAEVDAIVHAASAKRDVVTNVRAGTLLLERARRHGIAQLVFLSSLAAHEGALSEYGKQKHALQLLFELHGALVVRPGLVLGNGGTFEATHAVLRERRVAPLIDGGMQPLHTVYIDDLADAVFSGVERGLTGVFTAAEPSQVAYRQFYQTLSDRFGYSARFVSVPFWMADLALSTAAMLRIGLPIDRDSLLGLRAMRTDDYPRLEPVDRPIGDYRANIERMAEQIDRGSQSKRLTGRQ